MFGLFKKKEGNSYVQTTEAEVFRKDRTTKHVKLRRPKTAPAACSASPIFADNVAPPLVDRHSVDGGIPVQRPLLESAELLPQPSEPSGMQASQFKDLPPLPSRPTLGGPPVLDRSLSAASCELRNPFRSNTSDTVTTISMSRASSFGDAALPVRRTVPIWFPEQTEGAVDPPSHKAAIFTNAALGLDTAADPFSDDSSGNEDSELSTTPTTTSSAHSDMQEQDMRPKTQKRSRWSFLKSPKQSAQDFLQVHIPSGTLSPPARHRHSFWSRA